MRCHQESSRKKERSQFHIYNLIVDFECQEWCREAKIKLFLVESIFWPKSTWDLELIVFLQRKTNERKKDDVHRMHKSE
jgi:hypothetical protein